MTIVCFENEGTAIATRLLTTFKRKILMVPSLKFNIFLDVPHQPDLFLYCVPEKLASPEHLAEIETIQQLFGSVPIVLIGTQHQAEIALWAWRHNIWNYVVVPQERDYFLRTIQFWLQMIDGEESEAYLTHHANSHAARFDRKFA